MQSVNSLNDLFLKKINIGVTFGNFDGVHLGHKFLLKTIIDDCKKLNLTLLVVTFSPHPAITIFNKNEFLLNTYTERSKFLEDYGVEFLLEINFNRSLSNMDAKTFLRSIIKIDSNNIKKVYLGHDFSIGAKKEGGLSLMQDLCKESKTDVMVLKQFEFDNELVSSGLIRNYLRNSNVLMAKRLLGRAFFISGIVKKGFMRGRTIGFPTANLSIDKSMLIPHRGVYITSVFVKNKRYKSVTNIGLNPTFNTHMYNNIETYILDFDENIYGEVIKVCFHSFLRKEKTFLGINELKSAIQVDVEKRRIYHD